MQQTSARPRFLILGSLVLVCSSLVGVSARAQTGDDNEARAKVVFQEARTAYLAGDYAVACPKYEEVVRLRPGLGARLGLGDCYRKQGKLARAWETYRGIADDAPGLVEKASTWADKTTAKKRGEEARSRLAEVEPELGWLTIVVAEPVAALPGLVLQLDGVTLGRGRYGVKLPADRGEHVIDASAPGKKSWEKSVAMGAGAELTVGVQSLEDEAPAKPPEGPNTKPPEGPNTKPPDGANTKPPDGVTPILPPEEKTPKEAPQYDFFSTRRVIGLGLSVAGIGALGVGSYFGLDAIDKRDQSTATGLCVGSVCEGEGYRLRQASYDAGNVSTGLFVAGGVLLVSGVTLFLTAPKKQQQTSVSLVVGRSSVLLTGRF